MTTETENNGSHNEGPLVQVGGRQLPCRPLFSAEQIAARVKELATSLEELYTSDDELTVLICLDGAFVFAADLVRQIGLTTRIESVKLKSYEGTHSTGSIKTLQALPDSLAGRHVVIVEDIVDSGRTLAHLISDVKRQQPASLRTVVLLDKPSCHEVEVSADLTGFSIGPRFVVGYGLDVDGRYRNLPFIAEVFE